MGIVTYTEEHRSAVAPLRMFKALVVDSHNVIPKVVPDGIKSIEIVEGDGGAGSIKVTKFAENSPVKYTKHKIDVLDMDNYRCKYTLIESGVEFDKINFVVYDLKITAADGGCVCKMISEYHAKEGCEVKEDDIKQGKEKAMGLVKAIEAYLLDHPDVCA